MKVAVVLGTRPEIIKMAPVIRAADEAGLDCTVIHTGQHYSFEMDAVFFEDLGLRPPDVNLGVGSGSHPYQLAEVLSRLESVLMAEAPDIVLVEGDTNSVLAAALTANKLGMAVGHIEAGLRSHDRRMPEEVNRILVDHLADELYAPTATAAQNLSLEGLPANRIRVTGNTVVDELLRHRARATERGVATRFGLEPDGYAIATVHRAENVDDDRRLAGIMAGLGLVGQSLDMPVLLALHPRTRARLTELAIEVDGSVNVMPPLGYLDFLSLHQTAGLLLTDSGGLQEEACTLGVPCVTMRDTTERPESLEIGASWLAGANANAILAAAAALMARPRGWPNPFGDGHSGERIVQAIAAGTPATVAISIEDPAATPSA
jgi:UDP-N-acetylglucosamine 2-epimerase (non-hydrolysing)